MVWDLDRLRMRCMWNSELLNGISNCCFSNDGSMVAGCAMDDNHSIAVYDVKKGTEFNKDPSNKDFGLIAMGKITKCEVFDMRFVPGDW